MSVDVAVVNYGAGNLTSVVHALSACGARPRIAASPDALSGASLVVVPGVGHFQVIARALDVPWRAAVRAHVTGGRVLLGICLGMQWLFEASDEAPGTAGIGLVAGRCRRLTGDAKVPHVGWNTLERGRTGSRLLDGIPNGAFAYFTHAYAAPADSSSAALTTHGETFTSAVEQAKTFGTQFHPEKSGAVGLRILANVLDVARGVR